MNNMFIAALEFAKDKESAWNVTLDLREYLTGLIDRMADKKLAEQYREELNLLTDKELREVCQRGKAR